MEKNLSVHTLLVEMQESSFATVRTARFLLPSATFASATNMAAKLLQVKTPTKKVGCLHKS